MTENAAAPLPLEQVIVQYLMRYCTELAPNDPEEDFQIDPHCMEYSARELKQNVALELQMGPLVSEAFDFKKLDDDDLKFAYYLFVGYWLVYRVNSLAGENEGYRRLRIFDTGARLHAEMCRRNLKTSFDDP